jgi:hypothetical protein
VLQGGAGGGGGNAGLLGKGQHLRSSQSGAGGADWDWQATVESVSLEQLRVVCEAEWANPGLVLPGAGDGQPSLGAGRPAWLPKSPRGPRKQVKRRHRGFRWAKYVIPRTDPKLGPQT